ncbi:MAG: type I restriction-modification system subunit M [Candidatus Thiodiazotropha endolucinida]|nr:type I restriction-modification system subunit M [Candidatus Thiodiazotropha taylori]MCW4268106.1 type I restriction-modification system subunit M [Candidatus Thiodiazotropha endolucinida]
MTQAVISQDKAARVQDNANLIWGAAEKMRGKITPADYGKVILPFTVLRRMDCMLEPLAKSIKAEVEKLGKATEEARDKILYRKTRMSFYGTSDYTMESLLADPENIADNLKAYINALSKNMRDVFIEHFGFFNWIDRLDKQNLLYALVKFFADKDLSPKHVSTIEMGYLFENLIRRFNEASNATAGDHYTPREVIRLMTSLLFAKDGDQLSSEASVINILDPACGTGGMLSTANDYLVDQNANLRVNLYGQEVNPESFAICRSDMLITGHSPDNIRLGNTLTEDQFEGETFTYCLSNPPYGVDYSEEYDDVKAEHEQGEDGRFEPGIPRKSDGQLLFLLHMISKLPRDRPGRIAVIMNGSPLFNGDAGGGESEIRRYLMERDMVDAIIALPTDLFYNTGIATYIWVVTNRKAVEDQGKVRLINATACSVPMRKSLGSKRKEISDQHIADIVNLYLDNQRDETVQVFEPQAFGYRKITVDRPLRLDVDLTEGDPGRFRNTSELDEYFLWMESTYGKDAAKRLKALKAEVTEYVEEFEGLTLLKASESASKAEINAAQKRCKKILKSLLSADEWKERHAMIALIRGIREQAGQSDWMDYNAFLDSLKDYAREAGERLVAARIKAIRAWVTQTNPKAEKVIDKVLRDAEPDEHFGIYQHDGELVTYERDTDLGDTERVPLGQDIVDYFEEEVLHHVPDAWINPDKRDAQDGEVGIVGYEINFNRYFYQYVPPRPLAVIDAELKAVEAEISELLAEVAE